MMVIIIYQMSLFFKLHYTDNRIATLKIDNTHNNTQYGSALYI